MEATGPPQAETLRRSTLISDLLGFSLAGTAL